MKIRKYTKAEKIRNLLLLSLFLFGIVFATAPISGDVFAQCSDGVDGDGNPCLDLDATG